MANAAGGNAIDLTPGKTLVKYIDQLNSKLLLTDSSTTGVASDGLGGADSDMMLEHNEVFEIKLSGLDSVSGGSEDLTSLLKVNTTFSLEVIPPCGSVLFIERTTPVSWDITNSLD